MAEMSGVRGAPLTIKFDGERHEVEVTTYTRVLLDFAEVMKAANRQAGTNANIDVNVIATGEGSFESFVQLVASNPAGTLEIAASLATVATALVATGIGAYKLHRWLSKHEHAQLPPSPITADSVTIGDTHGDSITVHGNVYQFYVEQPAAREALTRSFAVLDDDEAITALEMNLDAEDGFRAEREDFAAMSRVPVVLAEQQTVIRERVRAELRVVRVVLERTTTRRWEFIWGEHKISANITDERFLDRVEHGEAFCKGDALICELEVTKEYEPAAGVYWNKRYTVVEVLKHVPAPKSIALF